jgi:hypothetical protein
LTAPLSWNWKEHFNKHKQGRDVSLLIKAVIAMARYIAMAVDSACLPPQAEEALAQVEK